MGATVPASPQGHVGCPQSPPPRGCPLRGELPWRQTHKGINPPCRGVLSPKPARRFPTAPRLLTKRPERRERRLPSLRSLPGVFFCKQHRKSLAGESGWLLPAGSGRGDPAPCAFAEEGAKVQAQRCWAPVLTPRGTAAVSFSHRPLPKRFLASPHHHDFFSPYFFFFLLSFPSLFSSPLTRLLSASPEVFPNCAKSSGNSGSARRGGRARRPAPRAAGRSLWPRRGGTRRVPTSAGPWAKRPGLWGAAGSAPPRSLSNSRKKSWEDPSLQGPKRGCAPRRGSAPGRAAHGPQTRSPPDPWHPSSPMGTAAHRARTTTRRAPRAKGGCKNFMGTALGWKKGTPGHAEHYEGRWVCFVGGETEAERGRLESPWPLLAQGRGWCEIGALPGLARGGGILVARTHTCSPTPCGAGR